MDDGCYNYPGKFIILHTESFTFEENNIISIWFKDKFNISPSVRKKNNNYILYFNTEDTKKIIELIDPFVITSMKYKLGYDIKSHETSIRNSREKSRIRSIKNYMLFKDRINERHKIYYQNNKEKFKKRYLKRKEILRR